MAGRSRTEPSRLAESGSKKEPSPQLTDDQWFLIEELFPVSLPNPLGGRPPHCNRDCLEGILFVLLTGCRWKDLPRTFPSKSVCHQRFKLWTQTGVFQLAWQQIVELRDDLRQLDLDTLIADATFVPAKKGGNLLVPPNPAKDLSLSC